MLLFFVLICWVSLASAASLDTIVITQGRDNPTRIGIVPMRMDGSLAGLVDAAEIVAGDLARSGEFAPIARDNMLSMPVRPEEVIYRDWRVLGAEFVSIGQATREADGRVTVTFYLFDVPGQRQLLMERVTGRMDQWRDIAHRVADLIYEKITGVRGAFSTRIAYVLAQYAGTSRARYSIEVADADGERSRTIYSSSQPLMSVSWAPDARRIAYVSFETGRPSIVIQDVYSLARERIASFRGINSAPVFSPDGRQLAMVLSRDGNPEIYLYNLTDRTLRRLTRNPAIDTEPTWAPDGRRIIFTSDRGGKPQIYALELATNFEERLTFEGDYNARARMLDDGNLVFVHRSAGIFNIAWQDMRRDRVVVLTRTNLDESPSVAPNGAMLMYATQARGKGILAVVSIDGSVKYELPSSSGDVREPAWSPFMDPLSGR
ncbi:MAG: Tol-Pal system beta propeller repeat protein TolB [Pseudomonadales bacterium]|nr:Tol-Pal system beta propeller repeat protein TolB [Pseudomonadales bacterium]MCP5184550.1 Tol-Pal system beta propeller repeat protein TolB [Pseudomonadales bacterium]